MIITMRKNIIQNKMLKSMIFNRKAEEDHKREYYVEEIMRRRTYQEEEKERKNQYEEHLSLIHI